MTGKSRLLAVVPVKQFSTAKSRLRPVVSSRECAEMAQWMLEDVLSVLTACQELLSGVLVVTSDQAAAEIARRYGARAVLQDEDRGINAAIVHAIETAGFRARDGLMVVPSDMPQLTCAAIAQAAAAVAEPHSMAIAAAAEDGGTNLFACRPANIMSPRYGPNSFEFHRRAGVEAGIGMHVLDLPELALDIDRPRDLKTFLGMQTNTHTHAFLLRRGIAERIEDFLASERELNQRVEEVAS